MDGIESIRGVAAELSRAQIEAEYQVRVFKKQQEVVMDLGSAALKLIQTVLSVDAASGQNINVQT
ncbi:MAG: YjfB family protein [Candidatus Hydrogenedentes bacterium]|nr:YjfB family protein [Candidatus Hydrogenedentota bacterium]